MTCLPKNSDEWQVLTTITLFYFRIFLRQKDYLNCYKDDDKIELSEDIRRNKCTWLAVAAVQRCNKAQRIVFNVCYGSEQPAHIERIQQLYTYQLQLPKLFENQTKILRDQIQRKAEEIREEIPPQLFSDIVAFVTK